MANRSQTDNIASAYTAIIVEDEPLARAIIREYLADETQVRIIAECASGKKAVKTISGLRPDIVFLDIQLPGMNGFDVLAQLEDLPHIVFSTAYDRFALQAFEVNAVDYLLKPYTRERFDTALGRVLQQLRSGERNLDRLASLMRANDPRSYADTLFVRTGTKILAVRVTDICSISAAGDYCTLHTEQGAHVCTIGISELEQRLDPSRFVRVHRSAIIALPAVRHIESDGDGGYLATMRHGASIRISRSYAAKIKQHFL